MDTNPKPAQIVIGVSTKTYFSHARTLAYTEALVKLEDRVPSNVTLFFIPSFPSICPCVSALPYASSIWIGAQDCHEEDAGAFTGFVSPAMLKEIGCKIVELGHAERRRAPYNESDTLVARKAVAAARNGLVPLVCIGERKQSSSGIVSEGVGIALSEVITQVLAVLDAVPKHTNVIFAYEPVWAIGAQKPAGADHIKAVVGGLKDCIRKRERTESCKIIYGGSAGVGTWSGLSKTVDGLFLGRFAHDVEELAKVIKEIGTD